jgi:hypothetical protein
MIVIDEILNEWSFRCHDGVVDLNDPKKVSVLNEILNEYDLQLNEDNSIDFTKTLNAKEVTKDRKVGGYRGDKVIAFINDKKPFTLKNGSEVVLDFIDDENNFQDIFTNHRYNELTSNQNMFVDDNGKEYKLEDIVKTADFGGKVKGFSTKHETSALNEFDALIKNILQETNKESINIKVGDNIYNNIIGVINQPGVPKSDFNLIKDIVERNIDNIEEDINITVSTPLYLGLLGTMLGIVIGLFNIPDISSAISDTDSSKLLNDSISIIIGGVKIAMIASFTGLFLTIVNSSIFYKSARSYVEAMKNSFYSFLQIELLPLINQDISTTFESLQRNLLSFNVQFKNNLNSLSTVFESNSKVINSQKELLELIDKTKLSEMMKYNIKVLQQLDVSMEQIEKFNKSFKNINNFLENTETIVEKTNDLLERTDNFKLISDSIQQNVQQNNDHLDFISGHFKILEEHKFT